MKKITMVSFFFSAILILSIFTSVSASKCIKEDLNEKLEALTKKNKESDWFPGFFIFQLIKGAIALVIILLILFDIIDPDEVTI